MPTFVYLPNRKMWMSLSQITCVAVREDSMDVWLTGDPDASGEWTLYGGDIEVMRAALAKFTMPEK